MKDSFGTYDGRVPEPPYLCPSCADKGAEVERLREALACTSENCSEFGRYHDGDCSECPQGTIRARAGLAAKEGTSAP